jgi:hypothetical protein
MDHLKALEDSGTLPAFVRIVKKVKCTGFPLNFIIFLIVSRS